MHAVSKGNMSIAGRARTWLYGAQGTSSKAKKSFKHVRCIKSAVNTHIIWAPAINPYVSNMCVSNQTFYICPECLARQQ